MGERGHTPGPWFVTGDPGHESKNPYWKDGLTIGGSVTGTLVCEVTALAVDARRDADARLIAAAPDMFEALEGLLDHYLTLANSGDAGFWDPEKEPQVIAARAALAKASPTSEGSHV